MLEKFFYLAYIPLRMFFAPEFGRAGSHAKHSCGTAEARPRPGAPGKLSVMNVATAQPRHGARKNCCSPSLFDGSGGQVVVVRYQIQILRFAREIQSWLPSTHCQVEFSKMLQNFPKASKRIRTHPDASECIPNASEQVQTGRSRSENFEKVAKMFKISRKTEKNRERDKYSKAPLNTKLASIYTLSSGRFWSL